MKPRRKHGKLVAQLRKTIGKSQSQFAEMVGVSKHTIISLENRDDYELTPKLAKRIQAATGAAILDEHIRFEPTVGTPHVENPRKLPHEAAAYLHNRWDGTGKYDNTYTREDFEQWRKNFYPCDDRTAREHFKKISMWIEFVFRAAAKPRPAGKQDRFPAIYQSLVDWLNETRETFSLKNEIEELLENETHDVGEMGFSISTLLEDPKDAKAKLAEYGYDFSEVKKLFRKQKTPFYWLIIETEHRLLWDPFDGSQSIPCTDWKLLNKPKYWLEDWRHFHKRILGKDWDYGPGVIESMEKQGIKLPPVDPEIIS